MRLSRIWSSEFAGKWWNYPLANIYIGALMLFLRENGMKWQFSHQVNLFFRLLPQFAHFRRFQLGTGDTWIPQKKRKFQKRSLKASFKTASVFFFTRYYHRRNLLPSTRNLHKKSKKKMKNKIFNIKQSFYYKKNRSQYWQLN